MNNKFCPNCGYELEFKDSNFCPKCSYNLNDNNFINYNPKIFTNGMAISGFVLSIVSFVCCFGFLSLISLILSIIGFNNAKKHNVSSKLSIAGIILSIIGLIWICYILWVFRYT